MHDCWYALPLFASLPVFWNAALTHDSFFPSTLPSCEICLIKQLPWSRERYKGQAGSAVHPQDVQDVENITPGARSHWAEKPCPSPEIRRGTDTLLLQVSPWLSPFSEFRFWEKPSPCGGQDIVRRSGCNVGKIRLF